MDFEDEIRLRILRWGDYLNCKVGPMLWKVLIGREVRIREERRWWKQKLSDVARSAGMWEVSGSGKVQEINGFSQVSPKKTSSAITPWFLAHWDWVCISHLQKCKKIHQCFFYFFDCGKKYPSTEEWLKKGVVHIQWGDDRHQKKDKNCCHLQRHGWT